GRGRDPADRGRTGAVHGGGLTPYVYWGSPPYSPSFLREEPWPGLPIVNIGWLEPGVDVPATDANLGYVNDLEYWMNNYQVRRSRGSHECGFCIIGGRQDEFINEFRKASTEFRVLGHGKVYAAPYLLQHYVVQHGYRPPTEFVEAIHAIPIRRMDKLLMRN
ncbi:hypothetical protein, partial [Catellatospora sp. NPDC049609]|uniref:DUF7919 family protein n=1 Tax=Catellatospora sp. NPDC049609 TaxID=3155505 RepID=UPI00342B0D14